MLVSYHMRILAGWLMVVGCATVVLAQEATSPAESQPAAVTEPAQGADAVDQSAIAPETAVDDGTVTLDFKDADIKNVLKILSIKSGLNIITTPDVTGVVTVQLNNVPWKEALSVILSTYGYAFEQKGNIIIVSTIEDLKKRRDDAVSLAEQEAMVTKTFMVNFAKAESIIETLKKLASSRGSVDFDQRTNMLIVTDIQDKVNQIADAISRLDAVTPQILIEGKIVETTFDDVNNLGIRWSIGATTTGPARPHTWPFRESTSSHYARDSFPGSEDFTYGTLDLTGVSAVFEALKKNENTNVVSSPRIVTQNNQTARINVGEQYPIPSYTYNEQQGALQVSGWEYKDIGVTFEVTPHANNAGFVTMDIKPQITSIEDTVTVENTDLPLLKNQSAQTQVMVKDGETLVIAGLVTDTKTKNRHKVPVLGSIPVVSLLFAKKEDSDTKTDLMVFLTPHIVTPVLDAPAAK